MTNGEFYVLVSCVARVAAVWLHEGVILKLVRGKHDEKIVGDGPARFCKEIRELLADIENPARVS